MLSRQIGRKQTNKGLPLVLILDSLDQLNPDGSPQEFKWLPKKLHESVRVVLSTLPDMGSTKYGYLTNLQSMFEKNQDKFLPLTRMPQADVDGILQRHDMVFLIVFK